MFDALVRCRQMNAAALRAELQGATTRLGFPELDLSDYLAEGDTSAFAQDQLNLAANALLERGGANPHE